jgi:CGNR zinc finger
VNGDKFDAGNICKYLLYMSPRVNPGRHGLHRAPGGLSLVQEFLNTRSIAGQCDDLLASSVLANQWANREVARWAADRRIQDRGSAFGRRDLTVVRELRDTIVGLAAGNVHESISHRSCSATFALDASGDVRLEPAGQGWRWFSSALWGEILLSQQVGTWARLKICGNPDCASAFYDRSKNRSAVWHDVKTCGNVMNLRASRARRAANRR